MEKAEEMLHLFCFFAQFQHLSVHIADDGGTVFQIMFRFFDVVRIFFVTDMVVNAGPKIHSDRSNLDFNALRLGSVVVGQRNVHNQMEALITAFFGIFDIVFLLDQGKVPLAL